MTQCQLFATCPLGLENLLFNELLDLGAEKPRETVAGVYFHGDRDISYRVCLWSRLASKILLPLTTIELNNERALYEGVAGIAWDQHLGTDQYFRVDFAGTDQVIRNSQFGAVRVKDAIVDYFQQHHGRRPSVDRESPQLIVNARLAKGKVHLSLDLSGESLHRRGYRQQQGAAPLKENLAAAILLRAGWPQLGRKHGYLIDPMCGSGTLLIEGTLMAADSAPGLLRRNSAWGFTHWQQFDAALWQSLLAEAEARKEAGLQQLRASGFEARGYDCDGRILQAAEANSQMAGLTEWIRFTGKAIEEFTRPTHKPMKQGLVVCNPPYGERLGEKPALMPGYRQLGQVLRNDFTGWEAAVITSNRDLAKSIGISHRKKYQFRNGALPAELYVYTIDPKYFYRHLPEPAQPPSPRNGAARLTPDDLSPGAKMVYNRLRKNQKQLRPWIKREGIECYRVYDADLPEYAAAIDIYGESVHIQEYTAPVSIETNEARRRFDALLDAASVAFKTRRDDLYVKQRRRNKGKQQYQRLTEKEWPGNDRDGQQPLTVREGRALFLVDLRSYLDTGLFPDHRPVRRLVFRKAAGKTFLNLFCYTATATVQAALGGAVSSVSVDMSKTYLDWSKKNFQQNNINVRRHQLVQQDCLRWLQQCRQGFDLILLDPPSFSNSKRMETTLDIQRDHVALVKRCMDILLPGGTLIFSTNLRTFRLDGEALRQYSRENISSQTLDPDFQRNPKIHQCWLITHSSRS